MSSVIVDARGWQNSLDLKTGEKIEAAGPVVEMVKGVLQRHPYPGDMDPGSNRWVTDTALDLVDSYNPRFVFLTYAAQYFSGRYTAYGERSAGKDDLRRLPGGRTFPEHIRFCRHSDRNGGHDAAFGFCRCDQARWPRFLHPLVCQVCRSLRTKSG